MARPREGTIHESADELARLASQYAGTAREARVRMLLAILEHPDRTNAELGELFGKCARQIQRWWTDYQTLGLQRWLRLPQPARHPNHRTSLGPLASGAADMQALLRFVNAMPTDDDPDLWLERFHASMRRLLTGVDALILNVAQTTADDDDIEMTMLSRQHPSNGLSPRRTVVVNVLAAAQTPGEITIAQAAQRGFPTTHYQHPHVIDYYVGGRTYVGTIVLLREKSQPGPIPPSTIALLESLYDFIAFAFDDCVKRRMSFDPGLRFFYDLAERCAARIGLGQRELEVFVLQHAGLARKEIAGRLHITECAVAKRAASIRRKAGTRNLVQLLAMI